MYDPRENVDRHNPNYPANDSVWKAQNKCIPARKVKKDKLQMNQNSNSQGNLVVLLIPYFFSTKKSDVCPARIQPSLKKTFKRCGVIILGYFAQCNANSIPPPPSPPPHRTDGFSALVCYPNTVQCFFIRMLKDPSPTLHSFLNNFLAWWTSFIDTARNTLLKSVKLPSLRAICQSKTNLDNLDLQSHKI